MIEKDLDAATHENLKLKGLNFELDMSLSDYQLLIDQTQKRLRLMQERSGRIVRELESSHLAQEHELKKATADLDVAKRDLEKLRKEREHVLEDLRRLESENSRVKREQPENKIEELEKKLRDADYTRKEVL